MKKYYRTLRTSCIINLLSFIVHWLISGAIIAIPTAILIATGLFFENDDWPITAAEMDTYLYVMIGFAVGSLIAGLREFTLLELVCEDYDDRKTIGYILNDEYKEIIEKGVKSSFLIFPCVKVLVIDILLVIFTFGFLIYAAVNNTSEDFRFVFTAGAPGMVIASCSLLGNTIVQLARAKKFKCPCGHLMIPVATSYNIGPESQIVIEGREKTENIKVGEISDGSNKADVYYTHRYKTDDIVINTRMDIFNYRLKCPMCGRESEKEYWESL